MTESTAAPQSGPVEPPRPDEPSAADELESRALRSRQRRLKTLLLVTAVLADALILAAWTQTWLSISLVGVGPHSGALDVVGSVAAPALSALALAGLALVAALAIAGDRKSTRLNSSHR